MGFTLPGSMVLNKQSSVLRYHRKYIKLSNVQFPMVECGSWVLASVQWGVISLKAAGLPIFLLSSVTNSRPFQCATSRKVKRESDWNEPKMMDDLTESCVIPIVLLKSNFPGIINQYICFSLRWYLLAWSWVCACQKCVCISGLFVRHHRVYIYSRIYFYIGTSVALFFFFLGVSVCVCRYMCSRAKTIFKGDIRDGWITENLLKRDNPSCTLIRHTPWFSNGIFSIISAVTVIPSSHSAQISYTLHRILLLSPNSVSVSTISPPPSLPMTLHKLLAIHVALVMLIGLAMAYAYPPSRV